MNDKKDITHLQYFEQEVYCWLEQKSSIMLKAISKYGDPVELSSKDARDLANILIEKANMLDELDK